MVTNRWSGWSFHRSRSCIWRHKVDCDALWFDLWFKFTASCDCWRICMCRFGWYVRCRFCSGMDKGYECRSFRSRLKNTQFLKRKALQFLGRFFHFVMPVRDYSIQKQRVHKTVTKLTQKHCKLFLYVQGQRTECVRRSMTFEEKTCLLLKRQW